MVLPQHKMWVCPQMYLKNNKTLQLSHFSVHTVEVSLFLLYLYNVPSQFRWLIFSLLSDCWVGFLLAVCKGKRFFIGIFFFYLSLSFPFSEGGINLESHEDIVICLSTTLVQFILWIRKYFIYPNICNFSPEF